jgi:superfamily I DNA/RNA helicase/RecB family exonuclease
VVLEHEQGPLLVTGGFGTGKTTVLIERFLALLRGGADPDRMALVLGSHRAREHARRALLARLPGSVPSLRVATLHGLAYQVVSARYHELRYHAPPTILTAADQFAKVQELLAGEDPALWPAYRDLLPLRGFADEVRQLVLRAQEALLAPDDIERAARARDLRGWADLAGFLRRYLEVLDAQGAVDFAGLIEQAAVGAELGPPMFDHLLVDDYQDTTFAAEQLLAALRPSSLVVAGNPEAHVFSFQGTTVAPLQRFVERFPGASTVELTTPHRSDGVTLDAWYAAHTSEELAGVARELRRIHVEEGVPWRDLAAVVRRQGARLEGLLRALDDVGVPRRVPERGPEIAAEPATAPFTLALRWIARPAERDALVEPLLTSELVGLSPAVCRGLIRQARGLARPTAAALELDRGLTADEAARLSGLRDVLAEAETHGRSVTQAFRTLWERLPLAARLVAEAETSPRARRDLEAVVSFARTVERVGGSSDPSVAGFVDLLETGEGGPGPAGADDPDTDAVQVLTAHGATGMEFDTVILVGAVEGDFPSLARPEPMFDLAVLQGGRTRSEHMRERLSDERRLFRSVLGRARRRVVLTASDPRGGADGGRSRFVDELGLAWSPMPASTTEPVSVAEAAAAWRRALARASTPPPERLAAIDGLLALGADPHRWWFQRDWTDTGRPLHETLRLSFSRLDTLENCELQFVLAEELGLSKRGGYQAWVGKLVHDLIERCEKGEIGRSVEALTAALEAAWDDGAFPSKAVSDAFRRLATERMLPNWVRAFGALPAVATEVPFTFGFDGATISGKIDRIGPHDRGFRITDFKTGNPDRAPKAAESLQLGIYYLAVVLSEEMSAYRPVRAVDLSYLRGSWKSPEAVSQAWPISPAGEEEYQTRMRERLSGLIQRIRELDELETYRPNPAAECYFCDFKPLCSLHPEGRPVFPIEGSS